MRMSLRTLERFNLIAPGETRKGELHNLCCSVAVSLEIVSNFLDDRPNLTPDSVYDVPLVADPHDFQYVNFFTRDFATVSGNIRNQLLMAGIFSSANILPQGPNALVTHFGVSRAPRRPLISGR